MEQPLQMYEQNVDCVTVCDKCEIQAFFGPAELAIQSGWEERDWGHICPNCISHEVEANEVEAMTEGAIDLLLGEGTVDALAVNKIPGPLEPAKE